jgi:hypothetical protein
VYSDLGTDSFDRASSVTQNTNEAYSDLGSNSSDGDAHEIQNVIGATFD